MSLNEETRFFSIGITHTVAVSTAFRKSRVKVFA